MAFYVSTVAPMFGCIPTYDGKLISGEHSLGDWKSLASRINRAAADLARALRPDQFGSVATSILNSRIAAAKSRQMGSFEQAGLLPGDIYSLDPTDKDRVLALYGQWLQREGEIPSI